MCSTMTIINTTIKGMYVKTNFDDDLTNPCEKTSALRLCLLQHCFQLKTVFSTFMRFSRSFTGHWLFGGLKAQTGFKVQVLENDTIRLIHSVEVHSYYMFT